ncbi:hypothetical protein TrVE_jg6553 [Triparma verrucosa]|uniref:Uncharacterized protein n=1 Tax=Triparma verrucosa TaxID=1606542 RepID=A0A9W7C693_9STRA|nr:hypothetical protein TrVE_jg6553 [Triparma verrucosa]
MEDLLDVLQPSSSSSVHRPSRCSNLSTDEIENLMMKSPSPGSRQSSTSKAMSPTLTRATNRSSNSRPTTGQSHTSESSNAPQAQNKPLFEAIKEEEAVVLISDEKGYRKPIYAEDFVDFEDNMFMTPRIIRPITEASERPSTANSWISSTVSEEEEPEEVPLDTWVDEPRLPNAFWKLRDFYTVELESHAESCERLQKLKEDLIFEKEVNVVQREQLKKEEKHTSSILSELRNLQKEHNKFLKVSDDEINELYSEITDTQEEIKRIAGEKMHIMYKVNRAEQELQIKEEEIKGFTDVKEKTIKDNEKVQKNSDVLQTGLKTVKQIGDSGEKEFQETSWKLDKHKKLVDALIRRVDGAKNDVKTWKHRYNVCAKDLSHVQKLMMSMSTGHTETQAVLYRDRALHYLKSIGAGGGIKESLPPVNLERTGESLLADALKDPELRREVGGNGGRAGKISATGKGGKMYSLGGSDGLDRIRRSEARTPDVRATKKKLGRYMRNNPADKDLMKKKKGERETQPLELEGADADFQTLLRVEWENDSSGRLYDDPPMSRMSAMSGASGLSGMSGVTAKSALSEGSALRWKTGSLRRRKEKAQQFRDEWVEGMIGGPVDATTNDNWVKPGQATIDYMPF